MRYEEWLEEDAPRWAVDHVQFGSGWGTECPLDAYSVAWSPLTGELYAVERGSDQVEVLAVIPDLSAVKEVTAGWEDQQRTEGGLYWLRARAAAALPPSLVEGDGGDVRHPGRRYRIDQADGTWWEVGWDRPLGTYYAQHYRLPSSVDDDAPLDWKGTGFRELPHVESLSEATGVQIPHDVAVDLSVDKAWFPNEGRPPFLDLADELLAGRSAAVEDGGARALAPFGADEGPIDGEDSLLRREAVLELRRHDLDRREADLARRERQLASQEAALGTVVPVEPRWSLPTEPVVRLLHAAQRATGDDLASVAKGFALDADWVRGVATGEVAEVDLPHIQQLCEGVKCSPYDLWGKDDAETVLHAYGPELWPRLIEPLQDDLGLNIDPSPGVDL